MKQDEWASRLNEHLKDYRKEPSKDLWEGIEASLNKQAKGRARYVSLSRWIAAAVVIGVIFGVTWMTIGHDVRDMVELGEKPKTWNWNSQNDLAQKNNKEEIMKPLAKKVWPKVNHEEKVNQLAEVIGSDHQVQMDEAGEISESSEKGQSENAGNQEKGYNPPTSKHNSHFYQQVTTKSPKKYGHISLGLFAQGSTSNLNSRNGVPMSPQMMQHYAASRAFLAGYEEREHYDQPISFGLTVSYPLLKWLSVSTGLVYTKLNSTFTIVMLNHQINRTQKLYYLGVPFNLQAHLWQWKGFNVYLTAGGEADWNIKAESNTDGIDQVMDKDRTQWSLGGGLGLEYRVIPQLSIYAEPGIRHYFNNGSNVDNYFKDKPTSFNLQLGLRFNINTKK